MTRDDRTRLSTAVRQFNEAQARRRALEGPMVAPKVDHARHVLHIAEALLAADVIVEVLVELELVELETTLERDTPP